MNPTWHRNKCAILCISNFIIEKGKTFSVLRVRVSDIFRGTQTYQIFIASYALLKKHVFFFFKIKNIEKKPRSPLSSG
jgi:hypothetical protein